MPTRAYILMEVEMGKVPKVLVALKKIEGVSTGEGVTGPYDVIAQVETADMSALGNLVVKKIQAIREVKRTITCPVVEF